MPEELVDLKFLLDRMHALELILQHLVFHLTQTGVLTDERLAAIEEEVCWVIDAPQQDGQPAHRESAERIREVVARFFAPKNDMG